MAVLQRAMQAGPDAAVAARHTLISNNPATQTLLKLLPDSGQLPTIQQLEQQESILLLADVMKLARQSEAANFEPLEVFTRSVQCTTRKAAVAIIGVNVSVRGRRPANDQHRVDLLRSSRLEQDLQQLGVQQGLADLIVAYLRFLMLRDDDDSVAGSRAVPAELYLNHMLPGSLQPSSVWQLLFTIRSFSLHCAELIANERMIAC